MTIAAGFRCFDGIVLCADTQITIPGFYKEPGSKIRGFRSKETGVSFYLAIAGHVEYANMTIEKIAEAFSGTDQKLWSLRSALDDVCIEIHGRYQHLYDSEPYCRPTLQMLGVLTAEEQGPYFLKINGPLVSPAADCECIGAGEPLAKYLSGIHYSIHMRTEQAELFAIYMLLQVKNHVDGCGGKSMVLTIDKKGNATPFGSWGLDYEDTEDIEKHFIDYDKTTKDLLLGFADLRVTKEDFEKRAEFVKEKLLSAREKRREVLIELEKREMERQIQAADDDQEQI